MMGRRKSILKGLSTYVKEHFTNAAYGAYPIENDSKVAIAIVASKYSPNNFWYGSPAHIPPRSGLSQHANGSLGTGAGARSTSTIPHPTRSTAPSRSTCTTTRTATCGC